MKQKQKGDREKKKEEFVLNADGWNYPTLAASSSTDLLTYLPTPLDTAS